MSPVAVKLARRPSAAAALIFTVVACWLVALHSAQLVFSPDEGIILDAAQRMLSGKKLYVDFFGYMSPGSYWLQALAFRAFGFSLRAGRLIVIFDFSLQCALVFWFLARAGYWTAAWATTALFFCYQASNPVLILPGHRWDSAALSLLSLAFCVNGADSGRKLYWAAAGLSLGFASFCTPSITILIVVTLLACLLPPYRRFLPAYCLFLLLTAGFLFLEMRVSGEWNPFLAQMRWLAANYSRVNITPYAWVPGGYQAFWRSLAAAPFPLRLLFVLAACLPALLPVAVFLGWAAAWLVQRMQRLAPAMRFPVLYLAGCLAGYVLSTYPRPDLTHLTIVAPLAYVLTALLICTYASPRLGNAIFLLMLPCALLLTAQSAELAFSDIPLRTPVGTLAIAPEEVGPVRALFEHVRPGQELYVHPYLPLFYFLTQTTNPTRYSYLAPGMMGDADEQSVLADLRRSPPDWLLYLPLQREAYLKVFPSAAHMPVHFDAIERWLKCRYTPLTPPVWVSGYELLALRK